jgi:murein DD-endopeptidase MepM/ murein hydrolase activator NlpD
VVWLRASCRAGAAAALALCLVLAAAAPAGASEVSERVDAQRAAKRKIVELRRVSKRTGRELRSAVDLARAAADSDPGLGTLTTLSDTGRALRRHERSVAHRLQSLQDRISELESWLYSWAVFRVCPVDPPRYIHDDYGEIVSVGSVEPHVHRGSDIEAPTWTPVRAPFDGYATSSYSPLGGYQVRVHGDRGYVFIAHLIDYGRLGWVRPGTIIGYVGSTGLSTAPHAHFEWHPWDGGAVDPYDLLRLTCG